MPQRSRSDAGIHATGTRAVNPFPNIYTSMYHTRKSPAKCSSTQTTGTTTQTCGTWPRSCIPSILCSKTERSPSRMHRRKETTRPRIVTSPVWTRRTIWEAVPRRSNGSGRGRLCGDMWLRISSLRKRSTISRTRLSARRSKYVRPRQCLRYVSNGIYRPMCSVLMLAVHSRACSPWRFWSDV